jgi:glycosyltransferase involved in cell wall biosynthesis
MKVTEAYNADIRVLIYVEGRYPTEKAYGVTTEKTIQSLEKLGLSVFVLSFESLNNESKSSHGSSHYFLDESRIGRFFRRNAYKDFSLCSKLFWWATRVLAAKNSKEIIQRIDPTVIWMRDRIPRSLMRSAPKQTRFLLEIHQILKKSEFKKISKLGDNRIVLAPISKIIESNLGKHFVNTRKVYAPMGVEIEMFKSSKFEIASLETSLKVRQVPILGYFGKIAPNGYSKGVEDLLELAKLHRDISFKSEIKIVGPTEREIYLLKTILSEDDYQGVNLSLIPHLPHPEMAAVMLGCDVLVLPTVNSDNYVGSPIKAIEYAATGKPILASSTRVNRDVFDSTFQPFWYLPNDIEQMHEKLSLIIGSTKRRDIYRESRKFAETRTWEKRTYRILESLDIDVSTR